MQFPQDLLFNNQYGGLGWSNDDPDSVTVNDQIPQQAPQMPQTNPAAEKMFDEIRRAIEETQGRIKDTDSNIERYSNDLDFSPVDYANKREADLFKWKGASKKRKAGTVGLKILDFLGRADKGIGFRERFIQEGQSEFDRRQKTIPVKLNNERSRETSLNTLLGKQQAEYEKARTAKEKNDALIEAKGYANRIQDQKVKNDYITKIADLEIKGELTSARVKEIFANMERPKNDADFVRMVETGQIAPGAFDKYLELKQAGNRGQRPWAPALVPGPTQSYVKFNKLTGEFDVEKKQAHTLFNRNTLEYTDDVFGRGGGKVLPESQVRRFEEFQQADSLLHGAAANALSDIKTGDIKKYTGLNNTPLGRKLLAYFTGEEVDAATITAGMQNPAFAALMHIKSVYGGRAPIELVRDIKTIVEGENSSPEMMVSILMSQGALTRKNLLEMAGYEPLKLVDSDPNFYQYIKKRMSALVSVGKGGININNIPRLEMLIDEYLDYKQRKTQSKPQNAAEALKLNPVGNAQENARKLFNAKP
jgi:hypothetical protein